MQTAVTEQHRLGSSQTPELGCVQCHGLSIQAQGANPGEDPRLGRRLLVVSPHGERS